MDPKGVWITINGIDLSEHIKDIQFPSLDESVEGVEKREPIQISGRFDYDTERCIVCRGHFVPGPEGTAYVTVEQTGERFGPVCHACGTSLLSPSEPV